VLISASAIGFYGTGQIEKFVEDSPSGQGFLSEVTVRWEEEARGVIDLGCRLILLRTGVVLSPEGGALSKMLLPFRLGLGGRLGSGNQFMSWIHLDDLIRLVNFALNEPAIEGPLNVTAPNPVTNLEFTRELGKVLRRPILFPVPGFVLRLALGEMADALLLKGQRVLPKKAIDAGFKFRFPSLGEALTDLLG
jgi:uncharacterized protein (TIGR01777 family)